MQANTNANGKKNYKLPQRAIYAAIQ